jgi:hypothetical protein
MCLSIGHRAWSMEHRAFLTGQWAADCNKAYLDKIRLLQDYSNPNIETGAPPVGWGVRRTNIEYRNKFKILIS